MYFRKFSYFPNFEFVQKQEPQSAAVRNSGRPAIETQALKDGIFRIIVTAPQWKTNLSQAKLKRPPVRKSTHSESYNLNIPEPFGLQVTGPGVKVREGYDSFTTVTVNGKLATRENVSPTIGGNTFTAWTIQ